MNKIREKFNKLSLQDKVAFNELTKDYTYGLNWLILPFYLIFYVGIFGLVLKYAFNINILYSLKIILATLIMNYWIFILAFIVEIILSEFVMNKRKKLLLNITKEDKNG